MSIHKVRLSVLLGLLLFLTAGALPAQAKKEKAPSKTEARNSRSSKPQQSAPPPAPALPTAIQFGNGQSIPIAEFVPRSEAAITQLGQILAKLRTPELIQAEGSLNVLSQTVSESAEDAKQSIRLARSAMQLPEIKMTWSRNRTRLDSINEVMVRYATSLDEAQKQSNTIYAEWSAGVQAMKAAKLPVEYIQRGETVLGMGDQTQAALREETERLLRIQVQISDTRTKIDDTLDQVVVADAALREQFFVIDSPPIWSALRHIDFGGTWKQVKTIYGGIQSRTGNFYQAYQSKLLMYLILNAGIFALLFRFSRRDPATWNVSDPTQIIVLKHPLVLTLFVMLSVFAILFAKAPPEVVRFARMLLVVPVVMLASKIFDERLRPHIIALASLHVLNVLSLQLMSGTVLRRFFVLAAGCLMLAGMRVLLLKGGMVRSVLEERRWNFVLNALYLGGFMLMMAILANIIGNVAASDILTNGTIFSTYYGLATYIFYLSFCALTSALTGSRLGQRSRAIKLHRDLVNRRVATWLRITSGVFWCFAVLVAFQISTQAFNGTRDFLRHKWEIGAISLSLLDVVLFLLVLWVSTLVAKLIRFFLNEEVLPRTDFNPGAAQAGSRLTYIGLVTVGVFLAFGAAGLELSKLTVLTGAFGVGLGFGLQNLVNNFVCGIIVSLERPVQVGDIVEIGTLSGEVRSIGFRSSTVRTFDGADVIVPNSELITKAVVNWSLTDFYRRTDIMIGAAYGTDPQKVLNILTELTATQTGVMRQPEPLITFDQFADSSLNFTVRFWSKLDTRLQIRSELNIRINEAFEENGIEIPFPQRDVHLHMEQETEAELTGKMKSRSANVSAGE